MDKGIQELLESLRVKERELSLLRERRRGLRERLRSLRGEAKEIRRRVEEGIEEILRLERKIKTVKGMLRGEVRRAVETGKERREIIRELRDLRGRLKEIRVPRGSLEDWREEEKRLEMLYETTDTDDRDEKRVVERIKTLARWISAAEERDMLEARLRELTERLEELKGEGLEVQDEIDRLRGELKGLEEARGGLLEAATLSHRRSDELREEIEEARREEEGLSSKIARLEKERKALLKELGIEEDLPSDQIVKVLEERERRAESARRKLSEKRALTFEEYAALVKKGLI